MNRVLTELPQDGPKNQKIKKKQIKINSKKEVQEEKKKKFKRKSYSFIRSLFKET